MGRQERLLSCLVRGIAKCGELFQLRASLVTQTVKNPPLMQEARVQSVGQEDPLEKGMATHSVHFIFSILFYKLKYQYLTWKAIERIRF